MAEQIDSIDAVRELAKENGIELNDEWCALLLELVQVATANAVGVSATYACGEVAVTYRARSVSELSEVRRAMQLADKMEGTLP